MYYIAQLKEDKAGVRDTSDGILEWYTNKQLVDFHKSGVKIYGMSVYNNNADCTALSLGKLVNSQDLIKLLNNWRDVHNPWTAFPVECYLAEAKVDTKITVDYKTTDSSNRLMRGTTILLKSDVDTWHFRDVNSVCDREECDTRKVLNHLEVATIYSKPVKILVQ